MALRNGKVRMKVDDVVGNHDKLVEKKKRERPKKKIVVATVDDNEEFIQPVAVVEEMHNSEKVVKKVDVVRMVEDTIEEANVGELSFVDTIQILEEHVKGMSENQVDSSIANQDDIFEYIIHEDENFSRVFSNVDFESTRNCTNNTSDSEDSHDENTTVKGGQYYEEGNLDDMFSQLEIEEGEIEKNAKLVFTLTKRRGRKLLYEGYSYTKDKGDVAEDCQWRCDFFIKMLNEEGKSKYIYCPGRCHTFADRHFKMVTQHKDSMHLPNQCCILYNLIKPRKYMLNYLKLLSYVPNFKSPTEATTDSELACINALLKVWPAILVFLCWFHFVQNLWKNIQLKKLKKDYVKDGIVRNLFKYIKFWPFVPITDVIPAFKKIKKFAADSKCTKFEPMLVYFEKFYIGKLVRGSDTVRRVPVYPIKMWNVVNRIKSNKDKSNNSLESWHKVFSFDALVHPTFNKLLENFRIEQKHRHVICQQLFFNKLLQTF